MDFELSGTERMLAEAARRLAAKEIEPVLAAHPADRPLPKAAMLELYRSVADLGFHGARVPEAEGGSGLSYVMLGVLYESLPPVLTMSLLGHEATIKRIHMSATPAVRDRFLPELLAGRRIHQLIIGRELLGLRAFS